MSVVVLANAGYSLNSKPILSDISLGVAQGEIFGVMGMSGSGKTTLLRLIMGLIRPTQGEVRIFGESINGLSENRLNRLRRRMGMVFQYAALFDSLTVEENVAFPLREHTRLRAPEIRAKVKEKLALVGLEGVEHLYPSQLSGGMRKRAGMARALALEPTLMLYDEPSSGLDPVSAAHIEAQIVRLRDLLGVTSIIVSHDVESILHISDRVAMLHEGRRIFLGTPQQARESQEPLLRRFVHPRTPGSVVAPAAGPP